LPPATLLASAEALLAAGATPHALFDAPKDSSAYTAIIANADLPRTQLSELSRSAPTLVALRAEDRKALEGFRKLGCIGWLIRPFRAESFISRVRLAAAGDNAALEPAVPPRGGRVLIADDNPVNALIARRALEKDGFRVTLAATGVEALESVATAPYDMILMDLRMPVMDGFEAMSRLREGGDMTPVIAVSAEVNPVIERRAKAAGADAVAAKPLDANALRAIAAEWAAPRADAAE
ncbi:MAG: response regulator, partial [Pseudomonadota bacterium]